MRVLRRRNGRRTSGCQRESRSGKMAQESLIVYKITSGANTYPHSGGFQVAYEGSIIVDDSDGSRDSELGDYTDTGGSDVSDQDVTSSSVNGISVGDTVDSRYNYTFTGSDGSSGKVYFLATNSQYNYGELIVSDTPLYPGVDYTFGTFDREGAVDYQDLVQCFVAGTLIETDLGPRAVETLMAGDLVRTLDDGMQPIRWIGGTRVPARGNLAPICIRANAMGNARDLYVSPQHRMMLSGWRLELLFQEREVLVPAKSLVNDCTILREEGGEVSYHHMLFDKHQIVFSEGIPSESFHPGRMAMGAMAQDARAEILSLFPELAQDSSTYSPLARQDLRNYEARVAARACGVSGW